MMTIKEYLRQCVEEGAFPGAAWQIGNRAGAREAGVVGRLGGGLGPVSPNTLYDLASLTKIIVTYALMRQLQDGLVRLEDPVSRFLPAYRGTPKSEVTLLELLTHTSAIPGQLQLYRHAHTKADLLEAIRWQLPRADSPERVRYTSKGYIVLGEVICAVDGTGLDEVVSRRVLEPLGMRDTCFNPPDRLLARVAPTEDCPWRGEVVRGQVHDENAAVMGGVCGHAGLFSTAADVARAAGMMLDGMAPETGERFFHPAVLKKMTRNYTAGKGENRGLGFFLAGPGAPAGDLMSAASFGHTGFTGTSLWVDPETGLYAVLLTNRVHPRRDNDEIFRVRSIFHNLAVLQFT